ncbi:MAG: 2-C-methyl-D-erythritol 4-phosphate cytidylyltransferase [Deltaproteobacteria bacterium]|nr:2-C-methyl-D-erythritol 4-phosphate cytidylyltransferase [Deltaproteobacteria bacterium]MBI3755192.1 2-C-methyl-D-erythritol 4-phosphate cytidylyltransferase [Deltaproteobacteria bacterium]
MKTIAIITAAGKGKRMGAKINKPYITFAGKPILAHTILPFEQSKVITSVIIVAAEGLEDFCLRNIVEKFRFKKVDTIVCGGRERQDSVMAGILAAGTGWDVVVVHDGVRPLVTTAMIEETVLTARRTGAATLAIPVKDTIKQVSSGFVKKTLQREQLWAIQTPQTFRFDILKRAHRLAKKQGFIGTDDCILVERVGQKVAIVKGSYDNIKITTPEDLILGEAILKNRQR